MFREIVQDHRLLDILTAQTVRLLGRISDYRQNASSKRKATESENSPKAIVKGNIGVSGK